MFTGFTPETIDFLWGVRMNNNRDWFSEHKKQYTSTLYEPMKELGRELFEPFLEKSGNIYKHTKINNPTFRYNFKGFNQEKFCNDGKNAP